MEVFLHSRLKLFVCSIFHHLGKARYSIGALMSQIRQI